MPSYEAVLDVLQHPRRHPHDRVRFFQRVAADLLSRHRMTAQEAAEVLGVSKPTVLSWIEAGILPEAAGSRRTKRLVETLVVYAARQVLDQAELHGSLEERAEQLRALIEEIYWATHPEFLDEVNAGIAELDRGDGVPASAVIAEIENRLAARPAVRSPR